MKKLSVLIILILLLGLVMTGCAGPEPVSNELSVYYVSRDRLYREAIAQFELYNTEVILSVTEFDDAAEMKDRVSTELMSGKGPDVILFNSYDGYDAAKLAVSGLFLPLDEMMREQGFDVAEDYFQPVMESGKIGDTQYFLPFNFNTLTLFAATDVLEERGLVLEKGYTYSDLIDLVNRTFESVEGEDEISPYFRENAYEDVCLDGMEIFINHSGIPVVDYEKREVVLNYDAWRESMEFNASLSRMSDKVEDVTQRFAGGRQQLQHAVFITFEDSLPNFARFFDAAYTYMQKSEASWYAFPSYSDPGSYAVNTVQFAAVNASTKNKAGAAALLKTIIDQPIHYAYHNDNPTEMFYSPVSRLLLDKVWVGVGCGKLRNGVFFRAAAYCREIRPGQGVL